MATNLNDIFKDFNKKPADKKASEQKPAEPATTPSLKTAQTISGGKENNETKTPTPISDIMKPATSFPPPSPLKPEPKAPAEPVQLSSTTRQPVEKISLIETFNLSPAASLSIHIMLIYANKGEGKTWLAFSVKGQNVCLSFDNKSESIRQRSANKDNITVYDAVRYLDKTSAENWILSSHNSIQYIYKILDLYPDIDAEHPPTEKSPDWITIDCGEVYETMAEMEMRYNNNLKAFEGFPNRNLWKERRMYLDNLLRRCMRKVKKGVIWTSYVTQEEAIEKGEFVTKKDVPKWIDCVLRETDVVIRAERNSTKEGQRFYATVETSKWDKIPETGKIDVTMKGISPLIKGDL